MAPKTDEVLTTTQACELLKISRQTLHSWIRNGRLKPWKKLGDGLPSLFLRSELNRRDIGKHSRASNAPAPGARNHGGKAVAEIIVTSRDQASVTQIIACLSSHNFSISPSRSLSDFEDILARKMPDVFVVDLDSKKPSGWAMLKKISARIKSQFHPTPILAISEQFATPQDASNALKRGAWDFLRKPLVSTVLLVRVRSLLRRKIWKELEATDGQIQASPDGRLRLNPSQRILEVSGQPRMQQASTILLTRKEAELLCLFLKRPGKIFSKSMLLELVWGFRTDIQTRTVDCHIKNLRQKLGSQGERIVTHYAVGYQFLNSA